MIACQCCRYETTLVLSLGDLPPCNAYLSEPAPQTTYPTDLYFCKACGLAQLGYVPPQTVTFPESYPYTSSTTRILRENFAQLFEETQGIHRLGADDLVIDIGGNDGNLLSNWVGKTRVLNVTPEDMGALGVQRGIGHLKAYWTAELGRRIAAERGPAKLITATNVFAHVPDPHDFVEGVKAALAPGGMFVSESHWLPSLLRGVQFETIYGEHARFYSLTAIIHLLARHDMTVIGARSIPTHGGSIRVYATRKGEERECKLDPDERIFEDGVTIYDFQEFAEKTRQVRRDLRRLVSEIRGLGMRIVGVGAPSRASTLVSYCGLNEDDIEAVYEVAGSHKLSRFMPGTRIEIREEPGDLGSVTAEFALLLSHHVGTELKKAWREKGYEGRFITPLPRLVVE